MVIIDAGCCLRLNDDAVYYMEYVRHPLLVRESCGGGWLRPPIFSILGQNIYFGHNSTLLLCDAVAVAT